MPKGAGSALSYSVSVLKANAANCFKTRLGFVADWDSSGDHCEVKKGRGKLKQGKRGHSGERKGIGYLIGKCRSASRALWG